MTIPSARLAIMRAVITRAVPFLLDKATDERLILLTAVLERVARTRHHKAQMAYLRKLIQDRHPAAALARRLLQLHPNVRRSFINGLGVNATWLGEMKRKEYTAKLGVRPPYLMVISPTMRCNLRCLGCYAGSYPREKDILSLETLDRIISDGKDMGIHFFTISGGEPFIRPDLMELYAKHSDCSFQVYTNGTLIDEKVAAQLQSLGNVSPAISVEGWQEQTDQRRGPGVYQRIMDAMDALREAGILFGFSATATRLNVEAYYDEAFYDLMVQKGCVFGWFFMFVPVGQDATTDLMITPEQRDRMRRTVMQLRNEKPIFVADFWNDGCLTGGCMSGGSLYLHVNYRGDLEPCVFMHFAEQNIHDIYARGGHLSDILTSPLFTRVRAVNRRDPNPLRPCPLVDHNEFLEEALAGTTARPTHPGAEDILGRLAPEVRAWSAEYAKYADHAWYETHDYDWVKTDDPLWAEE